MEPTAQQKSRKTTTPAKMVGSGGPSPTFELLSTFSLAVGSVLELSEANTIATQRFISKFGAFPGLESEKPCYYLS